MEENNNGNEERKIDISILVAIIILTIIFVISIISYINASSTDKNINNEQITNVREKINTIANEQNTSEIENTNSEKNINDNSEQKEQEMQNLYFTNSNIRWDMSAEELNDVETLYECYRDFENADGRTVKYYYWDYSSSNNIYDIDEIQYWVYTDNNKLNSYMLKIDDYGHTYNNYQEIKKALIKKYGKPTKENLKFNDKTYKNDLEKSIKYGYLNIKTIWTNQKKFDIIIQWSNNMCSITYCKKGYNGNY